MFEQDIVKALKEHISVEILLQQPPRPSMGDYAFQCFDLAKQLKKSPADAAKELVEKIKKPDVVERIESNGPYVNFFLDKTKIGKKIIGSILSDKGDYGKTEKGKDRIVAIDYSHPNIGKPFHFGHLRSTIIGESIANLLEFQGARVERINHLGDWGTQFGALVYAFLEWGDEKELDKEPIKYLVNLYVRFHEEAEKNPELKEHARQWFAKLEAGDEVATRLWGLFRNHSLEEFKRIYDLLGTKFDSYNGEAYYARQTNDAIDLIKKKGITEVDDGALIVRLEGYDVPLMLLKSDGSTTYASRDCAALMDRIHTLKATEVLYVVGHEQSLYFKQLFETMDLLGHPKENFVHVTFGLYLSPEGGKLSTRKGKIVLMEDVLKDAISLALKTIEEKNPSLKDKEGVSRAVAVAAILFGDLMNDRIKDWVFNLNRILSFEGDTGPYMMYTHARAASIIRKAQNLKPGDCDASLLIHDAEQQLLKILAKFPKTVEQASNELKPHLLAQYLLLVGHSFNEFYHSCPCLQEKDENLKLARLSLIEASRQVIENGLRILGITPVFEM